MDGVGTFKWANGDIYEGHFANGKRQGEGTITYAGGRSAKGTWDDGILDEENAEISE